MQRWREPRFACCDEVVVTVMEAREMRRPAQVTNISTAGMTLEMDCAVKEGSRLRMELQGTVMWGEAASCRRGAGCHYVGVRLEQASNSLAELARTLEEFAGQPQQGSVRMP